MCGVGVSEVAARHAAEITAADVRPAHSSATETRTAKMRTTEMPSAAPVAAATAMTATAVTATTPSRHAGVSSENQRGERNCRDEHFDNLDCHRGHSCLRDAN